MGKDLIYSHQQSRICGQNENYQVKIVLTCCWTVPLVLSVGTVVAAVAPERGVDAGAVAAGQLVESAGSGCKRNEES